MLSEARVEMVLCVCGVVVWRSSERAKAAKNPGRETARRIDAEKVAWGGCSGRLRQRGGATEEASLLRPHAAARKLGVESNCAAEQHRARNTGITGAVGQKTGVDNRRDARRYTRQEQSLGADDGRSFSQAGCLCRTTCHGVKSPEFSPPLTTALSCTYIPDAVCRGTRGTTAAGRGRELSVCSTNFGVLWHDSSSQPLCHRRSYSANAPYAKLVFTNCQLHHLTLLFIGRGPFLFETFPRQVPGSFNFTLLARDAHHSRNVIYSASSKVQRCPASHWSGSRPYQGRRAVSTRRQRPALGLWDSIPRTSADNLSSLRSLRCPVLRGAHCRQLQAEDRTPGTKSVKSTSEYRTRQQEQGTKATSERPRKPQLAPA